MFCELSFADSGSYELYVDKDLGVSFEYPKTTEVEDVSNSKRVKVWFHVGEWPKNVKYSGKQQPRLPVSGILFEEKLEKDFDEFVNRERKSQEKGGYRDQVIEKKLDIGNGISGIEFVRTVKPINKKMHYLIFQTNVNNPVLSLWHIESTETGFMAYPELEAKALAQYERMKRSLKIVR